MSENYEEKIERGLKLYLKEAHKIQGEVTDVELDAYDSGGSGGCDTCGYGDSGASFDINYRADGYFHYITIDEDPLAFFSTILPYIDRAN